MRKYFYASLALAAVMTVSCNKAEIEAPEEVIGTPITIHVSYDDDTKTTYADGKTFSWVKDDNIALQVIKDADNSLDVITLSAASTGRNVDFSGIIPEGYSVGSYAFYPKGTGDSYYSSDLGKVITSTGEMHLRTWGTITPDLDNPMGSIPLIGKRLSDGTYRFRTATGILKITVENIPADTYFFQLDAADGTALNGNFSFGDDCTLYMENVETAWPQKYVYFTPQADGETRTFYLPIPVGTIPAGMTASINSSSLGKVVLATTKDAITVTRNKVLNLGTLSVPYCTLDDILGTYIMTVTGGPYSSNSTTGEFVIEASDDPAQGNIMITKFAGVSGKQYGTFNGSTLTFPADQLFGPNPYSNASDYPYVALDAFTGGVTDVVFRVIGPGHIAYVGDALGFRATTSELWYNDNHNGAWPWSLCFGSVEAVIGTETWISLGMGRYMDEWFWSNNSFAPYNVEVEIWRSSLDANRYRVANPYTVANTAFSRTAVSGADDYLYLSVNPSTGMVTYETLRTGMDRSGSEGRNLAAAHPDTWNAMKSTSISASTTKVAAGTATAPLEIQMGGVYYDINDNTHFYTSNTGLKHLWFPGWDAGETWSDFIEGGYQDVTYDKNINGTDAMGTVPVMIQQSSLNANRFRVANPYRANVNASYLRSTYDEYLYFQLGNGRLYFEPFRPGVRMNDDSKELAIWHPVNSNLAGYSQGGSDFSGSSVLSTNPDGSPRKVQLGAHYFDIATPNPGYCYTRHGSTWPNDRIYITFYPADKAVVSHYEMPLKAAFHNPVAKLSLPSGTLERMVVKISGIDLSKVSGLRLYQSGWMDSGYVAPDADGVVTMTSFTNPTVTSDIDLNFWVTGSPMGDGVHFTVQEVVVDGVSLSIEQQDVVHLGGVVVNTGGDKVTVRNSTEETVTSFRIPALVTSNAGTLIAAYDVRYDSSADLQRDIDVGVKRSTDGGKTWSDLVLAMDMGTYGYDDAITAGTMTWKDAQMNNGIGDPCLLVDENTGRIFCFAVWAHGHYSDSDNRCLAWAGTGFAIEDTPQFMMVYSDDDGLTWSAPVNITTQIKQDAWRMTFQGPGRGITMKDGTLVIPIQHQEGESKTMHGLYPLNSGIAYSTDHGTTWHAHNYAHTVTSECAVAEIEPGVLMLSMRDETDSQYRRVFTTTDLGYSWTAHSTNGKVYEQSACEASLIHVDAADNVLGVDLLLMSNPQGTTGWRDHITIQASLDRGQTWTHKLLVDSGGSLGYSCLSMIDNATVGILYESSRGNIFFQAVPLTEIISD